VIPDRLQRESRLLADTVGKVFLAPTPVMLIQNQVSIAQLIQKPIHPDSNIAQFWLPTIASRLLQQYRG
jgi:hypothetical protein